MKKFPPAEAMSTYYCRPKDPIREVLAAMTGCEPPKFVRGHSFSGLSDAQISALQDWAATHCTPGWLTGIGLLDAAELQVREAVNNGNIPPEKQKKPHQR